MHGSIYDLSTMQHQEKYKLTWHRYSDHMREALGEMMTSSEFADVTLITDDKQKIRAHRNILSAASPVFKNILQLESKNTNPIIYLRGIQHSEMESVMQFIYLGEARFYEERMSEFLQVSKDLEIKDLSTGTEMNDQITSDNASTKHVNNADVCEDLAHSENENCADNYHTEPIIRNNAANRKVSRTSTRRIQEGSQYSCSHCGKQFNQQKNLTRHIQSVHKGVTYACHQCDHQATRQSHLKQHIQYKHEGVRYACSQCDHQATTQSSLTKHIQSIHEGVKYACNQCDYEATQQSNLTTHVKRKH